jgi:hypothetical protein
MIENFFKWMKKHDYFISGIIFIMNIGASIQSFERQDYTWGSISLLIAFAFWYTYLHNVNKEEPK